MDYELCKKLKEAGFPINGSGDFLERSIEIDESGIITTNSVYVPTLSELIEACGDKFEWLGLYKAEPYGYKDDEFFNRDKWVCGKWEDSGCSEGSYFIEETFGSTPEEAVANLWLELYK